MCMYLCILAITYPASSRLAGSAYPCLVVSIPLSISMLYGHAFTIFAVTYWASPMVPYHNLFWLAPSSYHSS